MIAQSAYNKGVRISKDVKKVENLTIFLPTSAKFGGGLPRQKLDRVHVAFRSMDSLDPSRSCSSKGWSAPHCSTMSRHLGESPAMLPSAHTACSKQTIKDSQNNRAKRNPMTSMSRAEQKICTSFSTVITNDYSLRIFSLMNTRELNFSPFATSKRNERRFFNSFTSITSMTRIN